MSTEDVSPVAHTRSSSLALDSILGTTLPVLDHGFVRVVDYMGNDRDIPGAARISYGTGTKTVQDDQGLINYLMRHWHTTPFEMCEIKLHVKLPVFVARQWIRHRTASVNEYSARYSILDKEFYFPQPEHMAHQSKVNNQGRGELLNQEQSQEVLLWMKRHAEQTYDQGYMSLIDDYDLARELARMNLPMNIYTQWYWKTNLHNLFRFLRLRNDPHAQYEIRAYAEVIENIVAEWVPMAYAAFVQYQKNAVSFSAKELGGLALLIDNPMSQAMVQALSNVPVDELAKHDLQFSKGEWKEFLEKLTHLESLKSPQVSA